MENDKDKKFRNLYKQLQDKISNNINKLLNILELYDPFKILTYFSFRNLTLNDEDNTEVHVEYLLSLILGKSKLGFSNTPSEKILHKIDAQVKEIFSSINVHFMSEAKINNIDFKKNEIRFKSLINFIFRRGYSYQTHKFELAEDLFKTYENFFENQYGIKVSDIIESIKNIMTQIETKLNRNMDCTIEFDKLLDEFENLFVIDISLLDFKEFLDLFSCTFGDNNDFITFKKTPAWPTNNSIIYKYPIIKYEEKYYCFLPHIFVRNLIEILEFLIKQKSLNVFQTYQKHRHHILLKKSLKYFSNIFPNAKLYRNLYYNINKKDQKRAETDGILIYDNNIFVIEAKAASLSLSARRGSIKRIKRDVTKIIDEAYQQAKRTKKYILSDNEPIFRNKNGEKKLIIKNSKKYENIFLINTTLFCLPDLTTDLISLKSLGLLKGKEWLWCVFLNDLRVISEFIEFPSQFIHYLKQRIEINNYSSFQSNDELDIFGFYFKKGFLFVPEGKTIFLNKMTSSFDKYYENKQNKIEKLSSTLTKEFKELVVGIEKTNKYRFTDVTLKLLNLDLDSKQKIISIIGYYKKILLNNLKKYYKFQMIFENNDWGIVFNIKLEKINNFKEMKKFCKIKKYQFKLNLFYLITIGVDKSNKITYNFTIFDNSWYYDSKMKKLLNDFKHKKIKKYISRNGEIKEDQNCPCGSGLKYKNCCKDNFGIT